MMKREKLILPLMMFGRFRRERAKRDSEGNTIKKNGKYVKEKVWVTHRESEGDKGVYPSVNHIYERMRGGRQKLTKPAEDLKNTWSDLALEWCQQHNWNCTEKEKVVVEVVFFFPNDNISRDTNNIFKLLMDGLEGIIYDNDKYALPRVMDFYKCTDEETPRLELNFYVKGEEHGNEILPDM